MVIKKIDYDGIEKVTVFEGALSEVVVERWEGNVPYTSETVHLDFAYDESNNDWKIGRDIHFLENEFSPKHLKYIFVSKQRYDAIKEEPR